MSVEESNEAIRKLGTIFASNKTLKWIGTVCVIFKTDELVAFLRHCCRHYNTVLLPQEFSS